MFEWVTESLGAQGTVCAGGRYDGLVPSRVSSRGVALLHTLQLGLDSLVRNSMDSLLNGQTIVCADLDFGLDSDLDGQGSALSLAGGVNADLRTADRLGSDLDSLFVGVAGNSSLMAS